MSSYCTIHQTKMFPSSFKDGEFYHYPDPVEINPETGKKVACHGEGLGKAVRNGRASDQTNQDINLHPLNKTEWQKPVANRDPEAEGKTRCQVAVAFIKAMSGEPGLPLLTESTKTEMDRWVEWIMKGK